VSFDPAQNNDETALRASREYVLKNNPDVRLCVSVSVFMCVLVMYTKLTDIHSHTLSHTSGRYVRRPPSQGQPWTSEIADEHQHSPILPHIRRQVCICTYGYECIVVYVLYVCTCVCEYSSHANTLYIQTDPLSPHTHTHTHTHNRSHLFGIRERPEDIGTNEVIHNVQVWSECVVSSCLYVKLIHSLLFSLTPLTRTRTHTLSHTGPW
jgi:hypothetical protein